MRALTLKKGFTLIEIVIVIAVLGILAGLAIPRFMDANASARGSRIVADMRTMESALSHYLIKHELKANVDAGNTQLEIETLKDEGYLASIPVPPAGSVQFPSGLKVTLPANASYDIYRHGTTGEYGIRLVIGGHTLFLKEIIEH